MADKNINNLNCFVLGGTGFLGYHAVLELLHRGHKVTVLALDMPDEKLLPPEVKYKLADIDDCTDDEIRLLFDGQDALVFAIGVDDRFLPEAPAYDFFTEKNTKPAKRLFGLASEAGMKKGVLCGSYFAYFDRIWPKKRLSDYHPYIRMRREQARAAIEAGRDMAVAVLELPYIFGSMPGRVPLWKPLIDYIKSPWPLLFTKGGTTMISVKRVAEAIAGAVEYNEQSICYPVGDVNMTWVEMLNAFSGIVGRKQKVISVPTLPLVPLMQLFRIKTRLEGKERGLHPVKLLDIQTINTFIRQEDLEASREALRFGTGGIFEAFEETVKACVLD